MKTEFTERRDFLKTLLKAGLAGAATVALATQAQAVDPYNHSNRRSKPKPKSKK